MLHETTLHGSVCVCAQTHCQDKRFPSDVAALPFLAMIKRSNLRHLDATSRIANFNIGSCNLEVVDFRICCVFFCPDFAIHMRLRERLNAGHWTPSVKLGFQAAHRGRVWWLPLRSCSVLAVLTMTRFNPLSSTELRLHPRTVKVNFKPCTLAQMSLQHVVFFCDSRNKLLKYQGGPTPRH